MVQKARTLKVDFHLLLFQQNAKKFRAKSVVGMRIKYFVIFGEKNISSDITIEFNSTF